MRRRRGTRAVATAVAAGLLLSLAAALPAQARVEQPSVVTTGPFGFGSTKIHLITGHEVEITRSLDGQYQVVPTLPEGPGQAPDLEIRSKEVPGQAPEFIAEPPGTVDLVKAGLVDPHLFDLTHLAEGGYAGVAIPVTVYFTGKADADAVAAAAAALPGGRFVPGSATTDRATVTVSADSAVAFWDAVTDVASGHPSSPYAPRALAAGISGLTLDGAAMSAPVTPNATVPTVKLTIRLHGSKDKSRWAWEGASVALPTATLTPVTGVGDFASARLDCETPDCQVMAATVEVPVGIWFLGVQGSERRYGSFQLIDFNEPELVIDGDTTVDFHVDDAIWVQPQTEKPSELAFRVKTAQRIRPDGTRFTNLIFSEADRLQHGMWLAPSRYPATTGAFNLVLTHVLQQPRVRLSVAKPRTDLELPAQYGFNVLPDEVPWSADGDAHPLVDGGYVTADRLAELDVRGKLVLLAWAPDAPDCAVPVKPFERARDAGAVAVVFDHNDDHTVGGPGRCEWPSRFPPMLPGMPTIQVPRDHAAALRELLAQRPVSLEVSGPEGQRQEYFYTLGHHFVGGVPAQIDQSFRDRELASRPSGLHGTAGLGWRPGDPDSGEATNIRQSISARVQGLNIVGGATFKNVGASDSAVQITQHIGPVSPDVQWNRSWVTTVGAAFANDIFLAAGTRDEAWLANPTALGPRQRTRDEEAWTSPIYNCNFCRMDNVLFPHVERVSGAEPRHTIGSSLLEAQLVDAAGNPIPLSTVYQLPAYILPPEPQRYNLRGTDSAGVQYEWTFNSGTAGDNRPAGTTCPQETYFGEPCGEPVPMIYLRHAAPVDINNTAPAGGWQQVRVTALHHMPNAPQITSVATEVSFDGGQTWQPTRADRHRDGTQTVTFQVPALAYTNGHVSLRTTASDTAGNSTVQTTVNAYTLR